MQDAPIPLQVEIYWACHHRKFETAHLNSIQEKAMVKIDFESGITPFVSLE